MNKKVKYTLVLLSLLLAGVSNSYAVDVVLRTSDEFTQPSPGMDAAARNLAAVLTEVNRAQGAGQQLNMGNLQMDEFAKKSLARIWAVTPFIFPDQEFVEKCVSFKNGTMMVRHVPLQIKPIGETFGMDKIQEAIVEFDHRGVITDFRLTLSSQSGLDLDHCGVADIENEHIIKRQLEQFRTAYNQKDAATIEAMFSDDALIITGKVVQRRAAGDRLAMTPKVEYTRQTKQQYIRNLKLAFARNKWIDVKFDIPTKGQAGPCNWIDRTQKLDKNGQRMNFYGVRLIQHWKSSNYSDDGYLFLLWEFPKDGSDPIIHVRTWQPMQVNGVIQEPDDNISTLGAFEDAFVL
jgi:hypothetical protein